jgi:replicative DNA helicase
MPKRGAKGKYEYWLTKEGLILVQGWARDGLIDEQIAHNMNISVTTLNDWKKKYTVIYEALKKGKEVVDYAVENALLKEAISGNVTAQIFWLKNRRPQAWRDKPEITMEKAIEKLDEVLDRIGGNI